jgi:hypothetical protein
MTRRMTLSWVSGCGPPASGGIKDEPTENELAAFLNDLRSDSGALTLSLLEPPEIGPQFIQAFADRGRYLLTLLEHTADGCEVRDYTNPSETRPEMVELLGNYWDSRLLTNDFSLVTRAFVEFYKTGDVSRDLLS